MLADMMEGSGGGGEEGDGIGGGGGGGSPLDDGGVNVDEQCFYAEMAAHT